MKTPIEPGFRAVFRREWRRLSSSWWLQAMCLFGPLLGLLVIWGTFSNEVLRRLPIVIVDADGSAASRRLTRMIDACPGVKVTGVIERIDEAQSEIRRLGVFAIVHIPAKLQHDLTAKRPVTVTCYYNAQLPSAGNILNREVGAAVRAFGAQYDAGRVLAAGTPVRVVPARLQPVGSQGTGTFNPGLGYETFLATAFGSSMLQFAILLGTVWTVGSELRDGTARQWMGCAGGRMIAAVTGKLFFYFFVYSLIALAALFGIHGWRGWPIGGSPGLLIVGTLAFVAACQSIGFLFVALTANLRLSLSGGCLFCGPSFGYCGVPLPAYAMTALPALISRFIPLSTYMKIYEGQALQHASFTAWLPEFAALLAFTIVAMPIAFLRMRKACLDPEKWGRR